jgi:hypothetical protein
MILLAEDCMVFETSAGEGVPYSADMISVELMGDTAKMFDAEFVKHAAAAVFHYFRDELGRETVTIAEFSLALERVLRGFRLEATVDPAADEQPRVVKSDLCELVAEGDPGCELFFFPRLRDELRSQLQTSPQLLCFQGLRCCVKRLAGAQRWSSRCQDLHDRIVEFLRSCMHQENPSSNCALVVR